MTGKTKFSNIIWREVFDKFGDKPFVKSCWALVTKDVIPDTIGMSYELAENFIAGKKRGYHIPTVLEACLANFAEFFKTGNYLYKGTEDSSTNTRTQDIIEGCRVIVGGYNENGLNVGYENYNRDRTNGGVAAVRILKNPQEFFSKKESSL